MAYEPGQRVLVRRGGKWLPGVVLGAYGDVHQVRRDDNGRRINAPESALKPEKSGERLTGGASVPGKTAALRGMADPNAYNPLFAAQDTFKTAYAASSLAASIPGVTIASRLVPSPKPMKAKRSGSYLSWVRGHSCQNCKRPPRSEAAHFGPRGLSVKTDDFRVNALCTRCHRYWHDHGTLPFAEWLDGEWSTSRDMKWTREQSEAWLFKWQVDLLIEFLETKGER